MARPLDTKVSPRVSPKDPPKASPKSTATPRQSPRQPSGSPKESTGKSLSAATTPEDLPPKARGSSTVLDAPRSSKAPPPPNYDSVPAETNSDPGRHPASDPVRAQGSMAVAAVAKGTRLATEPSSVAEKRVVQMPSGEASDTEDDEGYDSEEITVSIELLPGQGTTPGGKWRVRIFDEGDAAPPVNTRSGSAPSLRGPRTWDSSSKTPPHEWPNEWQPPELQVRITELVGMEQVAIGIGPSNSPSSGPSNGPGSALSLRSEVAPVFDVVVTRADAAHPGRHHGPKDTHPPRPPTGTAAVPVDEPSSMLDTALDYVRSAFGSPPARRPNKAS